MGWVKFVKINEDSEWVTYKYSHDCEELDGTVKIKKVKNLSDGDFTIDPSRSDFKNNHFAFQVILQVRKWINGDLPLLENYSLSYG